MLLILDYNFDFNLGVLLQFSLLGLLELDLDNFYSYFKNFIKTLINNFKNYLLKFIEDGNENEIITAIGNIAKAIGMTKIAEETGLSRPSLYKALSDGSKPQFGTIMKVLKAVGGQIQVNPVQA